MEQDLEYPLNNPTPAPATAAAPGAPPWDSRLGQVVVAQVAKWALAALAGTGLLLAAVIVLVRRPSWWPDLLAVLVVMTLATVLSLPPLAWGLRRGLNQAVAGYFIAAGLRTVVALGGCMLAIKAGGHAPGPTLLMMVPLYFALLAAESAQVGKALWSVRT